MRDFHNLDVWHKAHRFTLDVFHTTEAFPPGEVFQLAATLRRGAMFVTMRITEACGQDSSSDFAQGLSRARSMGMEVEYALLLAKICGSFSLKRMTSCATASLKFGACCPV